MSTLFPDSGNPKQVDFVQLEGQLNQTIGDLLNGLRGLKLTESVELKKVLDMMELTRRVGQHCLNVQDAARGLQNQLNEVQERINTLWDEVD